MSRALVVAAIVTVGLATLFAGARGLRIARTSADFLVATRAVPPLLNASAISGEYLSAASFLGIASLAMSDGLGALWYAVGYLAGYLVLLAVIAAPLRRFGAYTIPDFAEGRLDSPRLRSVATGLVLLICGFYVLPQLTGAGITLQDALGTPYWVGVLVLGAIVTVAIASGGMKSITLAQALQYWVKVVALLVPAVVLLAVLRHPDLGSLRPAGSARFLHRTLVEVPDRETLVVAHAARVVASGVVDGVHRRGTLVLAAGRHIVGARARRGVAAGPGPGVAGAPGRAGAAWTSPLVHIDGRAIHPLAATYGVIIATFLGAIGLPHILVRFYTNRDGASARRTTALVLVLLSVFYLLPGIFAFLGRLEAPGLYVSRRTDGVVLVLPHIAAGGLGGDVLGALTAAGAFAAFLSTTSGLLIAMSGALSHDVLHRGPAAFRLSALLIGAAATASGLAVGGYAISVLVGWAFAIAASSFGPLLVLGIWWRGLSRYGAIAGLLLGGGAASAAVVATMAGVGHSGWPAVLLGTPALWTVPLAFATMVVVSRLTPGTVPADVTSRLLALHLPEAVRRPRRAD
ncbi:MAG: sodium/solute symporter [Acidimicrobiales bacterium]